MNIDWFISTFFSSLVSSSITLAACFFVFKTWFNRKIESHFKISEENAKALLDIEKTKAMSIQNKLSTIYPELLEVTYRLRNNLREIDKKFPTDAQVWEFPTDDQIQNVFRGFNDSEPHMLLTRDHVSLMCEFNQSLFLLTDNLYKYRAFVSEDVFVKLHLFKRNLQDAAVIIDTLTRTPSRFISIPLTEIERSSSLINRLHQIYFEIDLVYETIKNEIQTNLKSHL